MEWSGEEWSMRSERPLCSFSHLASIHLPSNSRMAFADISHTAAAEEAAEEQRGRRVQSAGQGAEGGGMQGQGERPTVDQLKNDDCDARYCCVLSRVLLMCRLQWRR